MEVRLFSRALIHMNQKNWVNLVSAIFTLVVAVVGYFGVIKKPAPSVPAESIAKNEVAVFKTYKNEQYGFEFTYPANSTVESRPDTNYEYIRVQNYISTDDKMGLARSEYYLEIFIFDQKLGHKSDRSCEEVIANPQKVELGTLTGYRGLGEEGGDAGGIRLALCAERSGVHFDIVGIQSAENAPLVNQIFASFRFF